MTAKNKIKNMNLNILLKTMAVIATLGGLNSCKPTNDQGKGTSFLAGDAAQKVYVAPGTHDEFYNIVSGGFNGQLSVVGLPSGRTLKIIPTWQRLPMF